MHPRRTHSDGGSAGGWTLLCRLLAARGISFPRLAVIVIFSFDTASPQALEPAELSTAISALEEQLAAADEVYKTGKDGMTNGYVCLP